MGPAVENASSPRGRSRRWRRSAVRATVVVVAVVVIGYAAASWYVYDRVGTAPRRCAAGDVANTPQAFVTRNPAFQPIADRNTMPAPEEIRFASRDPQIPDVELAGWWIPAARADAPAVVVVHGIQSCRREANVLVPAGMLARAGMSVFLMDIRDHGDSGGDDGRFAGGSEEYLDVLGAWDWVRAQGVPAGHIGVLGVSFGAISSLIAGGEEPRVAAVWADSAASRLDEGMGNFVVDQLHDPTGISRVVVPGAIVWARVIAGDDLTKYNPIDEVRRYTGRSLAFVHGERDPVLPASMAAELDAAAVAGGAVTPEPWVVAGAGHTEAVFYEPAEYERRLVACFTAALEAR
jgi:dipeptidyl aminopeptidase/acylaminoacyl peptidase